MRLLLKYFTLDQSVEPLDRQSSPSLESDGYRAKKQTAQPKNTKNVFLCSSRTVHRQEIAIHFISLLRQSLTDDVHSLNSDRVIYMKDSGNILKDDKAKEWWNW